MNFSEKLIKLRKENGLSQEELGEKLNVTRQTVSKWELGQTTPEMSKLVEMSQLFGVTLDELTDNKSLDNENVENNNMEENHNKRNTIIVVVLVSILVVLIILGVNKMYNTSKQEGFIERIFDKVLGSQEQGISQNQNDFINQAMQLGKDFINSTGFDQEVFNSSYEAYNGTEYGSSVKRLLDKIVTNNKKEKNKIITVIYQGISINEPKEIQNLKTKFDDWTEYEVSFEYNENGYIYQTDIMDLN